MVRRLTRGAVMGAVTGIVAALAVLLLAAGGRAVVDWTTGRPHTDPGCQTVAFMLMTGVAPECR
ncbi:hypothetical protein EF910_32260 [Streptomyces sp. WAC07149]|uniref:hypothetical protein n=1 Tax=Streptomyces sp. WAC07149 TaxID=2487425 RepID=UPI000F79145D|nr:hypothetical protein [Streptomyces sp. WAC07149]RST00246.1 hypothetical protein EF910_32260 [Streptomyces sp. WAC07149]